MSPLWGFLLAKLKYIIPKWYIPLRFPQKLHDGADLAGSEGLAVDVVAHGLELSPELGATAYPCHQVVDGGTWRAVGEVE